MAKGPAEFAQGPMFIGFMFSMLLYGIMITQMYLYYTSFKRDKTWLKIFVFVLFLADTAHVVFEAIYLYDTVIIRFGDIANLDSATWVFAAEPAISALIFAYIQFFYAWRVKVISGNIWIAGLVVLSASVGLAGGLISTSYVQHYPKYSLFLEFQWSIIMWSIAECFCDVLIAVTLIWNLRGHKTGFDNTDKIVDKIIRLTMQTGLVTTLAALTHLILFLADRVTAYHLLVHFLIAKLYSNSLMSTLNSRRSNVESAGFASYHNGGVSSGAAEDAQRKTGTMSDMIRFQHTPATPHQGVFVQVESHQMRDIESNGTERDHEDTKKVPTEAW